MTQELGINDFFNPDGTLQKDENVKFENLIKYLDYLRNTPYGYSLAFSDFMDFFQEHSECFENYKTRIIKENLFEGTIALEFEGKEYVYTLPIELVWLLDYHIGGRVEKIEDQIIESYGLLFKNCSLLELLESLGNNRDLLKYTAYYYCNYQIEIGVFPLLLANNNFNVVKWALDNLVGFYIETDKVEDWEEEDELEDEEDCIFAKYNTNIPGFSEDDKTTLKALVYFLVQEGQDPKIIEYILSHIKNGREILEDPKVKNLIVELKSDTPNWNTIYGTLDICKTKGTVSFKDGINILKIDSFGSLGGTFLEVPKKNIENLKKYLKRNSNGK